MLGSPFPSYDLSTISRQGRVVRSFWQGSIPSATTYNFILNIPVGKQIYGLVRDQTIFDGTVNISFNVGGTYSAVAQSMAEFNLDEVDGYTPVCTLDRVTGLTGQSQRTTEFMMSPSTGPVRSASTQTATSAHPRFDSTTKPVFSYQNPGGAPVSLWLTLLWEEVQ